MISPLLLKTNLVRDKSVSYTHLRAHETVLDLVCRLLLEKKKQHTTHTSHDTTHELASRTTLTPNYP